VVYRHPRNDQGRRGGHADAQSGYRPRYRLSDQSRPSTSGHHDVAGAKKVDAVKEKIPSLKYRIISGGEKNGCCPSRNLWRRPPVSLPRMILAAKPKARSHADLFHLRTTGNPKMVRHNQSYAIAHTVSARYIQDLRPTDIIWVHADTGWAKTAYGKLFANGS